MARVFLQNWISLIGLALLLVCVAAGVSVFLAQMVGIELQYIGVVYVFLTAGALFGISLIVLGAILFRRRQDAGRLHRVPWLLRLNLEQSAHRQIALGLALVSVVGVALLTATTNKTLHYLESNEFCGGACHSVMHPEAVAHTTSPHGQIPCVTCHVGGSFGSAANAKLHGVRRMIGVLSGNYHKPIPTPVASMGSAREVCESCHARDRWIGYKEKHYTYYGSDDENTPSTLRLLMKIGGARSGLLGGDGIHYHMLLGRKIEFAALDEQRQEIAWIRVTEPSGATREFRRQGAPIGAELAKLPTKVMDCLDCHSRPAHQFSSPMVLANRLLQTREVARTLPMIKTKMVELLTAEYPDQETAIAAIDSGLRGFYEHEHPALQKSPDIDQAIAALQTAYKANFFPKMGVRWSAYPDHLGHRESPGCFRCHNDELVSDGGEPIFSTCTKCHLVLDQEEGVTELAANDETSFFHRADEEHLSEYTECTACHTGGGDVY